MKESKVIGIAAIGITLLVVFGCISFYYLASINTVVDEGEITDKRIEGGFTHNYILEIHNDTDIDVDKYTYYGAKTGDYLKVHKTILGTFYYEVIKK